MGRRRAGIASFAVGFLIVACSAQPTPGLSAATETPASTVPADCVIPPPDLETIIEASQRGEAAACYTGLDLQFDALWTSAGVVDCPGQIEPAWLYCPADVALELPLLGSPRPKLGRALLLAVVPPASGISAERYFGIDVRVVGHFDDPAAQTCRIVSDGAIDQPAVDLCRATFVVTGVSPLGP
jgi:hypothetical protein